MTVEIVLTVGYKFCKFDLSKTHFSWKLLLLERKHFSINIKQNTPSARKEDLIRASSIIVGALEGVTSMLTTVIIFAAFFVVGDLIDNFVLWQPHNLLSCRCLTQLASSDSNFLISNLDIIS